MTNIKAILILITFSLLILALLGCTTTNSGAVSDNNTGVSAGNTNQQGRILTYADSNAGFTINYPSDLNIDTTYSNEHWIDFISYRSNDNNSTESLPSGLLTRYAIHFLFTKIGLGYPDDLNSAVYAQRSALKDICPGFSEANASFNALNGTIFECANYAGGGYDRSFVFAETDKNQIGQFELVIMPSEEVQSNKEAIVVEANKKLDSLINGLTFYN